VACGSTWLITRDLPAVNYMPEVGCKELESPQWGVVRRGPTLPRLQPNDPRLSARDHPLLIAPNECRDRVQARLH